MQRLKFCYMGIFVFILFTIVAKADFISMKEFGGSFKTPLTKEELALFEPDYSISKKKFQSANFIKDGTFRGNFCKKGAGVSSAPFREREGIEAGAIRFGLRWQSGAYCQFRNIKYFEFAKFDADMKHPLSIRFGESKEKIMYRGFDVRGWEIFFNDKIHAQVAGYLKELGIEDKSFLLAEDAKPRSEEDLFRVYMLEPFEWDNIKFPAGSRAEFHYAKLSYIDLPRGTVVEYGNLKCKLHMHFVDKKLRDCMFAEDFDVAKGFILPAGMVVEFYNWKYQDSCGVPKGKSIKLNGKNVSLAYFEKSINIKRMTSGEMINNQVTKSLDCQEYERMLEEQERRFK